MAPDTISADDTNTRSAPSSKTTILIALTGLAVVILLIIRLNVFLYASIHIKSVSAPNNAQQEPAYGSTSDAKSTEEKLNEALSINVKPLGYNGDGLFDEPFDNTLTFSVGSKGASYSDAHDLVSGMKQLVEGTIIGMENDVRMGEMRQYGGGLSDLGMSVSDLPTEQDISSKRQDINSLLGELTVMRIRARTAQILGLIDTLTILATIALLYSIYVRVKEKRRKSAVVS